MEFAGASERRRKVESIIDEAGETGKQCFKAVDRRLFLCAYSDEGTGTWLVSNGRGGNARKFISIGHYPDMGTEDAMKRKMEIEANGGADFDVNGDEFAKASRVKGNDLKIKRFAAKGVDGSLTTLTTPVTKSMRYDIMVAAQNRGMLFRDYTYNLLKIGFKALEGRDTK